MRWIETSVNMVCCDNLIMVSTFGHSKIATSSHSSQGKPAIVLNALER